MKGTRLPIADSLVVSALQTGRMQRFAEIPEDTFAYREMGARSAIVTPMIFRNRPVGLLVVFDRLTGDRAFTDEDERLLQAFAASAATAVATAQNASDEGLRRSLEASEAERTRWARELHDETLQELAGLRVLLSGARRSGDPARINAAMDTAIEQLTTGIGDLRSLITGLRPAALDELGTGPALETMTARVSGQTDLPIELSLDLAYAKGDADLRHAPGIESTLYRIGQEALTSVVKHASAARVAIRVSDRSGDIEVEVRDDGKGFDARDDSSGFGLRERLALVRGTLNIMSAPGEGTTLRARIRAPRREARDGQPGRAAAVG
jgi:signal transduction histidine kinase